MSSNSSEQIDVLVAQRIEEAEGIISFELVPASGGELPPFEAGSHVDVYVAPGVIRQYSLCNDPRETHRYVLGILREAQSRGGSSGIHNHFEVGTTVKISAPRNNFKLVETAKHTILAGGGIGITPVMAMSWRLYALGASFELHYCTRSAERTAFKDFLKSAPFADKIFLHLDDGADDQRFNVDRYLAKPDPGTHLYICGPGGFMDYVTGGAKRLDWAQDNVHVEYFSAHVETTGALFTVRLAKSGKTLEIPEAKTIAEVLLDNKVDIPLSCEQGVCGTCLVKVLEGTPDHRDLYLTNAEKAANNQMLVCCSRSKSPLLVLDL